MTRSLLILAALLALAACGRKAITERDAPDELLAGRQAPLVLPPDFNLQPPRPGEPRPFAPDTRTEALDALFPSQPQPPKSQAEIGLLDQAGAARADPTARSTVGDPGTRVINKGAFVKTLVEAPVAQSPVASIEAGAAAAPAPGGR